jgi:dTDP-4-dehydrorhamnose reductase
MSRSGIVVIGSTGMLGRELMSACRRREQEARGFAGPDEIDITDERAVRTLIAREDPSVVINATGYTDVDGTEADPETADLVNRAGVAHLARACRDAGALLVHFSTDYVFNGRANRPYLPNDRTEPINAYGRSKLAGERAITAAGCRALLIRSSWLFAPHGHNFVRTILTLAAERPTLDVVDDQRGRPTYAADLAQITLRLLDRGGRGVYHAANDGQCTWFELAEAVVEGAALPCAVRPCRTADSPRPAARPAYSVLDLGGTASLVGRPRHWKEALADCLGRLAGADAARPALESTCETEAHDER